MKTILCALAFGACISAAAQDKAAAPTCNLVPGWTQSGPARYYTTDDLFEYMDGNSEGYFSYNFQNMHGVTCKKGDATFVVDVSDMGDADSAYGWFSANRDMREPAFQVGMGGQIVPRRLIFAKGKYYLEIAAEPDRDHSAALKEWALAMDKAFPGSTTVPPALAWFPAEKQQRLRLVPQSVLGLRILTRGYLAEYDFGKAFVVLEDTPESAADVMKQFKARFPSTTPATLADDAFQATDQYLGRLFVFRKGRYIAGWAISAAGVDPAPLSTQLAAKVQ